jgi:hypothetical protein
MDFRALPFVGGMHLYQELPAEGQELRSVSCVAD